MLWAKSWLRGIHYEFQEFVQGRAWRCAVLHFWRAPVPALGFAGPAHAQTTTIDSNATGVNSPGYGIQTTNAGGNMTGGVQQGALFSANSGTGTSTYISGGTLTSNGASNRTLLDPTGVTVKDSSGNVAVLQTNGVGVIGSQRQCLRN